MIRISLFVILLVLGVIVQGQYIVSRQTDSEEGCSGDRIADTIALGGQCSSVSNISVYQTCSGSTITSYECSDSSCGMNYFYIFTIFYKNYNHVNHQSFNICINIITL